MSACYYVLVADHFLPEMRAGLNQHPETGFRYLEPTGVRPDLQASWHRFEDDNADPSLEGLRVEPAFTRHDDGTVTITARNLA